MAAERPVFMPAVMHQQLHRQAGGRPCQGRQASAAVHRLRATRLTAKLLQLQPRQVANRRGQ